MERLERYCTSPERDREEHFWEYLTELQATQRTCPYDTCHHRCQHSCRFRDDSLFCAGTGLEGAAVFQTFPEKINQHSVHQLYWLQDFVVGRSSTRVAISESIDALVRVERMEDDWNHILQQFPNVSLTPNVRRQYEIMQLAQSILGRANACLLQSAPAHQSGRSIHADTYAWLTEHSPMNIAGLSPMWSMHPATREGAMEWSEGICEKALRFVELAFPPSQVRTSRTSAPQQSQASLLPPLDTQSLNSSEIAELEDLKAIFYTFPPPSRQNGRVRALVLDT
eukprot:scaffold1941_cov377-Prasinococcus_capsulatus_cf.AAC.16